MKILKFFFSIFLILAFVSQAEAQVMRVLAEPQILDASSCGLSMGCAGFYNSRGNFCAKITVNSSTDEYLYISIDSEQKSSSTLTKSFSVNLCTGTPNQVDDFAVIVGDTNYVRCGIQGETCLEGCDVVVGGGLVYCGP